MVSQNIKLAKYAGFCYGVKRAVETAKKLKQENPGMNIYILGELIHNTDVINELESLGIKTIYNIPASGEGICIIRSHGEAPEVFEKIKAAGFKLVDLTCPDVKKVQQRAIELAQNDYFVVIVGKSNHPEVMAIKANADRYSDKVVVAATVEELEKHADKIKAHKKAGVVVQTTQMVSTLNIVVNYLNTLAKEVLQGKPTAASVASDDIGAAEFVQKHCSVKNRFRLYTNSDVIGVELGGSLKNVIAIASGFAHTMGLGDNCAGALLTRGMAEIIRVSLKLGANPSTLYGLSGMGDLIATCSSPMSRNYTVGSMLAQGKKINDILAELGSVAEGVKTSKAICALAKKYDIEVPVSNAIYEAVYTDITPQALLEKLMNRKLKEEER